MLVEECYCESVTRVRRERFESRLEIIKVILRMTKVWANLIRRHNPRQAPYSLNTPLSCTYLTHGGK